MKHVLIGLAGLAVLGAILAAVAYQPEHRVRETHPTYVLGAGDVVSEFIDPANEERTLTVLVSVTEGGPVHAYVTIVEWLALAINQTSGELRPYNLIYFPELSAHNVSGHFRITLDAEPEVRYAVVLENPAPRIEPDANETLEGELDRYNGSARVRLDIAYPLTVQRQKMWLAWFLVAPSVLLVAYTIAMGVWRWRNGGQP